MVIADKGITLYRHSYKKTKKYFGFVERLPLPCLTAIV